MKPSSPAACLGSGYACRSLLAPTAVLARLASNPKRDSDLDTQFVVSTTYAEA